MKKNIYLIASLVFCAVAFVNFMNPIKQNFRKFSERFDPKSYEKQYNQSQYVIPQSKNPISDETLLSYAGYKYATGMNPILINSDHPPLGKYIIGWFTLLTGNNRLVSIFFALGNMAMIFLLIYFATKSTLLSSLGIMLLTFDSMFIDQIIHSPILDIIQVFFLLLYFLFFVLWLKKESIWKIVIMGIALGAMSATKLYFPALVVLATSVITLILLRKKLQKIIWLIISVSILAGCVYTASYLEFFLKGNSFRGFLGVQKWIFLFWKNNSVQSSRFFGDAITLMLFNRWKVWWGTKIYIQFEQWTILWPVFFILGILSAVLVLSKMIKVIISNNKVFIKDNPVFQAAILLSVWILLSTAYLSCLPISPRYLLILYFPIYAIIPMMLQLLLATKIKSKN